MDQTTDPLTDQLSRLITNRVLDPLEMLLGGVLQDDLHACGREAAARFAARLRGPDDEDAAWAAATLVGALYPGDTAFDPPADWWATPLGAAVLRRAGHPSRKAVSYGVAGAMLGISRQGVHDLVTRGRLDRDPDGGVSVASVRARAEGRS